MSTFRAFQVFSGVILYPEVLCVTQTNTDKVGEETAVE